MKNTIMLIHGSWHGNWCWEDVEKILKNMGYETYSPTLPGMKNEEIIMSQNIGLYTHAFSITREIEARQLNNVILIGHSYAGIVIGLVAQLIPNRIKKLIFLDAFIPDHNKSLLDLIPLDRKDAILSSLESHPDLNNKNPWLVPVRPPAFFGVTGQKAEKIKHRLVPTPIKTMSEPFLIFNCAFEQLEKSYIRCINNPLTEPFENIALKTNWKIERINSGHDAMITNPDELIDLILPHIQ